MPGMGERGKVRVDGEYTMKSHGKKRLWRPMGPFASDKGKKKRGSECSGERGEAGKKNGNSET